MPARLKKFEMPRTDIEAAMRLCKKVLDSRRAEALRGTVIRLRVPGTIHAIPQAWLGPEAALAA